MKQYLNLLQNVLKNGIEKESGRENMPNTIGISHSHIKMDLQNGFPLLTTKKMYFKGIAHELLWFLRGDTNIKYLVDNNVNIWNGDAYRWYLKILNETNEQSSYKHTALKIGDFVGTIKDNHPENLTNWFRSRNKIEYSLGDLGKVYGYQWRNQRGVDQVRDVIESLKNNPYSRYHILDGWNKADFPEMALPPCHLLYQFIVKPLSIDERCKYGREKYGFITWNDEMLEKHNIPIFSLDLNMYQRSVDAFLGLPFNLASMSLFLMIIAKVSNMIPGVAYWTGGDVHIYKPHIPQVKEQLTRKPLPLGKLEINKEINTLEDIEQLSISDFLITNYKHHESIKAELFTGLKK